MLSGWPGLARLPATPVPAREYPLWAGKGGCVKEARPRLRGRKAPRRARPPVHCCGLGVCAHWLQSRWVVAVACVTVRALWARSSEPVPRPPSASKGHSLGHL